MCAEFLRRNSLPEARLNLLRRRRTRIVDEMVGGLAISVLASAPRMKRDQTQRSHLPEAAGAKLSVREVRFGKRKG